MYALLLLAVLLRATNGEKKISCKWSNMIMADNARHPPGMNPNSFLECPLECWQGATVITTPGGTINLMALKKCPAHLAFTHCSKISCSMDEEALKEIPDIPPGTKSQTGTAKGCLLPMAECELPEEGISPTGVPYKTMKKYCKMSCCEGNRCNGTLGLRSLGTVAAIMGLFAAFFVRWN